MQLEKSFKECLSENLFFVRGIAIFLVVLGHVIGNKNSGVRQLYEIDTYILKWSYEFIYTFHIPVLLIVSGIAFSAFSSEKNIIKSLKSRVDRLIVPLIVWAPFYYIFRTVSGKTNFSFTGLINSVVELDFIFWFFHILLFTSIFSLIYFHFLHNVQGYIIISLILFMSSFYIEGRLSTFFYCNIFYTFGIAITSYLPLLDSKLREIKTSKLFLILFILLIIMIMNYQIHNIINISIYPRMLQLINGLVGFTIIYFVSYLKFDNRVLIKIKFKEKLINIFSVFSECVILFGRLSMSIYIFHVICGAITRIVLVKLSITALLPQFGIGLIFSLTAPILIYEIFKKNRLFLYSIGEAK